MPEGIKYPAALDDNGELVFIEDAPAEGRFFCPGCHQPMVPRRGKIKVWHFAHLPGSVCADPNTALHNSAKLAIAQGITEAVAHGTPYEVIYSCRFCGEQHALNLAAPGRTVHMEKALGPARADIAVLEGADVTAILEVIVTHEPTEQVFDLYARQSHPVAFIAPSWSEIEALRKRTQAVLLLAGEQLCPSHKSFLATYVPRAQAAAQVPATTTFPLCPHCGEKTERGRLEILDDYECYRCHKPIRIAILDAEVTASTSDALSALLAKWGVKTRWEYSQTAGRRYHMNICSHCGAKMGNFYLHFEVDQNPVVIDERILLRCDNCGEWHVGPSLLAKPQRQREPLYHDLPSLKHRLTEQRREASSRKRTFSKMKPIVDVIESVVRAAGASVEVATDTGSNCVDVFIDRAGTQIVFGLYNKWPGEDAVAARVAEMIEAGSRSVNLFRSMPRGHIMSPGLWSFGLLDIEDGVSVDLGGRHVALSQAAKLFIDGDVAFRKHMSFSTYQRIDMAMANSSPTRSRSLGKYLSVCGLEIPSTAILFQHPGVREALSEMRRSRAQQSLSQRWLNFRLTSPFPPVPYPHWCVRSEEGFCHDGEPPRRTLQGWY